MNNFRKYGKEPYKIVLVHGGPGAAGEMQPVAKELSTLFTCDKPSQTTLGGVPSSRAKVKLERGDLRDCFASTPKAGTALAKTIYVSNNLPLDLSQAGKSSAVHLGVLEPLQTRTTVNGQIEELREVLQKHADTPATLIGFSWGAWLVYLLAAKYPELVKKLILISSGAFEEKYTKNLMKERLERLNEAERIEVEELMKTFHDPEAQDKNKYFDRFGELMSKADNYDPIDEEGVEVEIRADIYNGVWAHAAKLRSSGELVELGKKIKCPVVAIHGDYDPTPADGIRVPLERVLKDFRFILLEKCGHKPWVEKHTRNEFYRILQRELTPHYKV